MNSVVRRPNRRLLAALALIAFLFAQSAALLHELSHAASGNDWSVPAGERTTLCKECVSHAPLLAMAGGAAVAFVLSLLAQSTQRPAVFDVPVARVLRRAFRARAPPIR